MSLIGVEDRVGPTAALAPVLPAVVDPFEATPLPNGDDLAFAASVWATRVTPWDQDRAFETFCHEAVARGRRRHTTVWGAGNGTREGRTFLLRLGLGTVSLRCTDLARSERTAERARAASSQRADALAAAGLPEDGESHRTITQWSTKSRVRMLARLANLDYAPMLIEGTTPGMLTLTYPGDWLAVAPSGRVVKDHMRALQLRWRKAFGWAVPGLWKLEFQTRGAPHVHLYLPIPARAPSTGCQHAGPLGKGQRRESLCDCGTFERWVSRAWADVVKAEGEEYRRHLAAGTGVDFSKSPQMSDAKRIAVYFYGHSVKTKDGKEYQHIVPPEWQERGKGPGRFWGHWGLSAPHVDIVLSEREYYEIRRSLRKVQAAADVKRQQQKTRFELRENSERYRRRQVLGRKARQRRNLGARGGLAGGWVMVNDAIRLGLDLHRLARGRTPEPPGRESPR